MLRQHVLLLRRLLLRLLLGLLLALSVLRSPLLWRLLRLLLLLLLLLPLLPRRLWRGVALCSRQRTQRRRGVSNRWRLVGQPRRGSSGGGRKLPRRRPCRGRRRAPKAAGRRLRAQRLLSNSSSV